MIRHYRDAQINWTPTNWEKFLDRANEDAQLDQIRELAKTADVDTLRATVNLLCDRLSLIGQKATETRTEIAKAQREIRRMSERLRG
jgi:hypothetical protein